MKSAKKIMASTLTAIVLSAVFAAPALAVPTQNIQPAATKASSMVTPVSGATTQGSTFCLFFHWWPACW